MPANLAIPLHADRNVSTLHPNYTKMIPSWEAVRDTMLGEAHMKLKGEAYLPMTSGQLALGTVGKTRYETYKLRSRFFDIVAPSVRGLVGLAHAKPATVELPGRMEYLLESATQDKSTLEDLARNVTREILQTGRAPILADAPIGGGDPYLTLYSAESFINWKHDDVGYYLAVFMEPENDDNEQYSEYDHELVMRYRAMKLVEGRLVVELYEEAVSGSTNGFNLIDTFTPDLDFIPLAVAGSINTNTEPEEPPMLPISRSAISAYQLSADYRQSLFMTAQPTPVTVGLGEDVPQAIGSDTVWHLPEGGSAFFLEVSGNGITLTKEAIDDELTKAEQHGAKLLQTSGGVESTDTVRLRMLSQYATLQSVVMSGGEAIEQSLKNIATWMGINPDEVTYKPNTDFVKVTDLSQLGTINQAVSAGNIPKEVLFEAIRQTGLTTLTDEELNDKIEIEEPLF